MKKILFLHGFFATGNCPMARALKEAFEGTAVVLTPDLPLHPKKALKEIRSIIDQEQPDLLLGNSCGSFLAQMLAPVVGIPALLGNPWGLFGEQDTLAHFSPLFLKHYNQAFYFPGGHTPTEQEVQAWYAPLAQKMLMEFSENF